MKDTVKLIIEMPIVMYDQVKGGYLPLGISKYLKNGIPLDDLRSEIDQIARSNEIGGRGNGKSIRYGLCMALEIIDKYAAESEKQ